MSTAKPLDPVVLDTGEDDWIVEILSETDSTNADLVERAKQGAPAWLVLAAEHQRSGRGRHDRVWEAPPLSGLTFSMLVRPDGLAPERWTWLPLVAGLAVTSALQDLGYDARVKWPNDVLIRGAQGDRKVCGLLVERVETTDGPAAVIGIGLNTHLGADQLPVPTATSLILESAEGAEVDRTAVLVAVLRSLVNHVADWLADPDAVAAAYRAASATLGATVRAELPDGSSVVGEAVAMDASGCLVIARADGTGSVTVAAGDVIHLRAQ